MDPTASPQPERDPERADTDPAVNTAYYLDHFHEVLEAVEQRYGFLLGAAEHDHIARIKALTPPARMLYARLVNRKGPCFRLDRLAYPEIPSLGEAITELRAQALFLPCEEDIAPDLRPLLYRCFTVPELRASLGNQRPPGLARREELLTWLDGWDGCGSWLARLLAAHPVLRLPLEDPWPFLRFLFFGELRDNLSDFVTRELGYVVTESIDAGKLRPQFHTRQQAVDAYRMACLYVQFREMRDAQPVLDTLRWWQAQGINRGALAAGVPIFDRLVDRLGTRLERAREATAALSLYATSPQAPARERRARILLKAGRHDEATALLQVMAAEPCHAEEAYAAKQLLGRLAKTARRSEARHYQRQGQRILLETAAASVETATLTHYRGAGWQGVHSENWLWNATFGLLLWDIIYDANVGAFHSPIQFAPADLHDPGFYERRKPAIEARLAMLDDAASALAIVARHHEAKLGLANPFVAWHADLPAVIRLMIDRLPAEGLRAVLRRLAQDIKRRSRGFPDLFLWKEADYRFVEVKSENDQLSPAQYQWLCFFEEVGLSVSLDNVRRA